MQQILKEKKQKLSPRELKAYRQAVEAEGAPVYLDKEDRPNKALRMMWNLRKKYRFGLRYPVEVTEDGYFRYKLP